MQKYGFKFFAIIKISEKFVPSLKMINSDEKTLILYIALACPPSEPRGLEIFI
jgi:hypothetical protein